MSFSTFKPHSGFVICSGGCGKYVPPHVTSDKCKYCIASKPCTCCGKPIPTTSFNTMCYACNKLEYPDRKCPMCNATVVLHKSMPVHHCSSCYKLLVKKTFVKQLGEIDDSVVIMVKFAGDVTSHDGYCSDHNDSDVKNFKIKKTVYFPAPVSSVNSEDVMNKLILGFRFDDFADHSHKCHCSDGNASYHLLSHKLVPKNPHMNLESLEYLCVA